MASKARSSILRVAVGSPDDPRSCVWRLWVHGDEVYFGTRETLRGFKVSLHKSGIWRTAFVRALDAPDNDADRVALKWQRPDEYLPGSTSCVAVVVSPILPGRPFKSRGVGDRRIKWLTMPAPNRVLILLVVIIKPGLVVDPILFVHDKLLGHLKKTHGESVCLIAHERDLTEPIVAKIHEIMRGAKINFTITGELSEDTVHSSRALMVTSDDQIGSSNPPTIYDVSLGWGNVVAKLGAPVPQPMGFARDRA
jgi:hypothetical protein